MPPLLKALRPSQWIKNLVVLAAYFFARWDPDQSSHFNSGHVLASATLAAVLFCLISSAVYLMNDIHDVDADRAHPIKRLRPIAAGTLGIGTAWMACLTLLALGMAGTCLLPVSFRWLLCSYVALQAAYTFGLKRVSLLDVFMIASGFVLRAIGGALAIDVRISPWLLLCTFLLALFLGLCKRRHEKLLLEQNDQAQQHREALAGYGERMLDLMIGIAAAAAIVSYALYTLSGETIARFGTNRLGLTIPFAIFGIFRYLDVVYRQEEGGRPEKVLLTDRVLIATVVLYALVTLGIFLTAKQGF